jgi:hypothetical protein
MLASICIRHGWRKGLSCYGPSTIIVIVDPVQRPSLSLGLRNVGLLAVATVIFFWQIRHPVLRLTSPSGNAFLTMILGLAMPWLTALAVFRLGRWWSKVLSVVAALPLLIYSFVFLIGLAMTGSSIEDGRDLGFDPFAVSGWNGTNVRFYRTNGGITTAFGVVVRQEKALVPGVVLVRNLDSFYPCRSVDAAPTDAGISVFGKHSDCSALSGQRREYKLKRFVYF